MVSDSEKLYIVTGCDQSFRSDGRGCFDYREVNIENSILPHVGTLFLILLFLYSISLTHVYYQVVRVVFVYLIILTVSAV